MLNRRSNDICDQVTSALAGSLTGDARDARIMFLSTGSLVTPSHAVSEAGQSVGGEQNVLMDVNRVLCVLCEVSERHRAATWHARRSCVASCNGSDGGSASCVCCVFHLLSPSCAG